MTTQKMLFPKEVAIGYVADSIRFRQIVRFFSVLFITLLLLNGCEDPHLTETPNLPESPNLNKPKVRNRIFDAAINEADLQFRRDPSGEKIYHAPNQEQPYTGWVKNIRKLQQFRDGKKHGVYITWYGNWQKAEQGRYKHSIRNGLWTLWYPDGQKENEGTYKDGNRHGPWTLWHPDGQKESEITYEDGRVLTLEGKPQTESDSSDIGKNSEHPVPLAFVLRNPSEDQARLGLPEGAKLRLGKGEIKDFAYSPDGTRLAVATTVGIWIYDGHTGEELAVPGYTDFVRSIAFSPDGKTFASSSNRAIYLWDTDTGKEKRIITGSGTSGTRLLFSLDGLLLASANANSSVYLWDPHTGTHRFNFAGDKMSFSPDGSTLVTVSGNDLFLWDTLTGQQKQTLNGHSAGIGRVLFSPDGLLLASAGKNGTVYLWNTRTGQQRNIPTEKHGHAKIPFSFSPDGKILASCNSDGIISLWDTRTGQQKQTLPKREYRVSCVSFSPNGETLASGSGDGTIYLWDLHTGQQKSVFTGYTVGYQKAHQHSKSITRLAFNPDGTTLVSKCEDTTLWLWNIGTGQHKNIHTGDNTAESYSLAMSPDSTTIASGSNDGIIRLWDARTGQRKGILTGHTSIVSSLAFSPGGTTLASGGWDNTIRLWNPHTGQQYGMLEGQGSIKSLMYSPDGEILASGDSNGIVRLWDVRTQQQKNILKGHTSNVYSVAFSPNGRTLASGEQDKIIHLWDVHTGERKKTITDHTHYVSRVLFSPDGTTLVSGSWDKTIRFWDAHTGEYKKTLIWDTISCLALSSDGQMLASGGVFSRQNSITPVSLWDVKTGQEKKTFMGHTDWIHNVLFSPDGTTLASGSRDGTILLWDLTAIPNVVNAAK